MILAFLCLLLTSLPSSFQQNPCHCIRNILKFQGRSSKHVLWSVVKQHMCFVWPSLNLKSLKFVHNMKKSGAHHKSLDFGFSRKLRCGNRWSTFPHGSKWPELNSGCPFECDPRNPQHSLLLPFLTSFICTVCLPLKAFESTVCRILQLIHSLSKHLLSPYSGQVLC